MGSRHVAWALLLSSLLGGLAAAQSNQPSEFELLRPGEDKNLQWVKETDALKQAEEGQKPILVYFFDREKTTKNARAMISAQFRVFPDEDVQSMAAESFICTKVDLGEHRTAKADARREGRRVRPGPETVLLGTPELYPDEPAIFFLDYKGRLLSKETKVPSSGSKFLKTLKQVSVGNQKRILLDERAAKKAAEKAAKEAERAAREAEREKEKEEEDQEEEK